MDGAAVIHGIKEFLDMLNTDGGHIVTAIFLLLLGLVCLGIWKMDAGRELFLFAFGLLGKAMNSTGKANGVTAKTSDGAAKS